MKKLLYNPHFPPSVIWAFLMQFVSASAFEFDKSATTKQKVLLRDLFKKVVKQLKIIYAEKAAVNRSQATEWMNKIPYGLKVPHPPFFFYFLYGTDDRYNDYPVMGGVKEKVFMRLSDYPWDLDLAADQKKMIRLFQIAGIDELHAYVMSSDFDYSEPSAPEEEITDKETVLKDVLDSINDAVDESRTEGSDVTTKTGTDLTPEIKPEPEPKPEPKPEPVPEKPKKKGRKPKTES